MSTEIGPQDFLKERQPRSAYTWAESIESFQARHNEKRTFSERLADYVTAKTGTVGFLLGNCVFFAVWLIWNTKLLPGTKPFDPFPFVLLTTIVSLEAIVLAIFVLISQNRQSRVQDLRQEMTLQIDMLAEHEVTKLMNLVTGLYKGLNIDLPSDPELAQMSKPTDPQVIEQELTNQIEQTNGTKKSA